jgi:hypothetical protein
MVAGRVATFYLALLADGVDVAGSGAPCCSSLNPTGALVLCSQSGSGVSIDINQRSEVAFQEQFRSESSRGCSGEGTDRSEVFRNEQC